MVTKRAFEEVGGFDEKALPQEGRGEDVEFISKVKEIGRTALIQDTYVMTSNRRQRAEGYLVTQHWNGRAIRRKIGAK